MKKTIIILSAVALLGAAEVRAEEASLTATVDGEPIEANIEVKARPVESQPKAIRTDLKSQIEAKKVEVKAELEARKADLRAAASSTKARIELRKEGLADRKEEMRGNAADRIRNVVDNAIHRLNLAFSKLTRARMAIESRLGKFASAGADVSVARESLAAADLKLDAAESAIAVLGSIDVSTSTRDSIQEFKSGAKRAQTAIQEAHRSLMGVVSDMKGLQSQTRPATTTP